MIRNWTRQVVAAILIAAVGGGVAWAADEPPPPNVQFARKGRLLLVQPLNRPALINRLVKAVDPVELPPRDVMALEAFLAANSSPRRLWRDGFYSDTIATRGFEYDDPVNHTLSGIATVNRDEWQRLRMHLLFNKLLLAEKQPPAVVR